MLRSLVFWLPTAAGRAIIDEGSSRRHTSAPRTTPDSGPEPSTSSSSRCTRGNHPTCSVRGSLVAHQTNHLEPLTHPVASGTSELLSEKNKCQLGSEEADVEKFWRDI